MKPIVKALLKKQKVRKLLTGVLFIPSFLVLYFGRVFDTDWYRHQKYINLKGRASAVKHYLLFGRRHGLSPSPFFTPEYMDRAHYSKAIVDPLVRYVVSKKSQHIATSVLYDPAQKPKRHLTKGVSFTDISDKVSVFGMPAPKDKVIQSIEKAVRQFGEQESAKNEMAPVNSFDRRLERQTIEAYQSTIVQLDDRPVVSIVTPTWNRAKEIVRAVKSVQAQTLENWEMLIVDDGSTDDTASIMENICADDPRIKFFQPGRGGVCKARNVGIENAQGQWVAFLDSDNTWTPHYLQTMIASAIQDGKNAAYSAIKMDTNGTARYRTTSPNESYFNYGNYVDLNSFIVKKDILAVVGSFDQQLRRMVDYDLIWRVAKQTQLLYVPIVGVEYEDNDASDRITTTELTSWDGVVKNNNGINWSELGGRQRDASKLSILIPVMNDFGGSARAIKHLLQQTSVPDDAEIIILDGSFGSTNAATLSAFEAVDTRVRYEHFAGCRDLTLATNYAFAFATGENLLIINPSVDLEAIDVAELVAAIDDKKILSTVQLHPHRYVASAGVALDATSGAPIHILQEHPTIDSDRLGDTYEVPALPSGIIFVKASVFVLLKGLNPLYDQGFAFEDFSLRARQRGIVPYIVNGTTVINRNPYKGTGSASHKLFMSDWQHVTNLTGAEIWNRAGFDVIYTQAKDPARGKFGQTQPLLARKDTATKRWAIKISAPSDDRRKQWGDVYFAEGIRDALQRLGQDAFIDYREAHYRSARYLDDVNLDLRGLDNYKPQPGQTNIMWLISHPEKVSKEVITAFDKVYAASAGWAKFAQGKFGVPVEVLLQCTDTDIFHPPEHFDASLREEAVFVGNSRNVFRHAVREAVNAQYPLSVYGGGWEQFVDRKYIKGSFVPNNELHRVYGSARVVLNDHWDDMKNLGFISNRVFDVLASGGRLITDGVTGIGDIVPFTTIQVYNNQRTLSDIMNDGWWDELITREQQEQQYEYIKNHHSFDARARQLLSGVMEEDT